MRRSLLWAAFCGVLVFFAPALWLRWTTPVLTPDQAAPAEAALVFGARVRGGTISPLHRERLETARALWASGTVSRVVVSNAPAAARAMQGYLLSRGIPPEAIELDGTAISTLDTCRAEAARPGSRRVILISQRFHLPRIGLHCARYDLDTQFVMADSPDRAVAPLWTRIRVRSARALRETALIWGVLLGLYPRTQPSLAQSQE